MMAVLLVMFLAGFVGIRPAMAQADSGSITGVVTDPSKAVIPAAQVTLTSVDTGLVSHATTDRSGVYTFSPVKIGDYTVTATANGFATTTRKGLHVNLQQRIEADVQLTVGASNQQVEVTAAAPVLQTQSGAVGQSYSAATINNTPLNGRNYVYIAQLSAGVVPDGGSRGGGTGDFTANGQSNTQNNFMLNGVDNNTSVVDYLNQASYTVLPPPDALAEFRVQTAEYSAEFGHSAGAVVNASVKSGTNQLHGDFWEFLRNTALNDRDWDQPTKPVYHQNQFGGDMGFPIIKNKLFIFGDVQDTRVNDSDPSNLVTVPTAKMRTGDFSDLYNKNYTGGESIQLYEPNSATPIPGNRLDLDPNLKLDPIALKILSMYPCPNTVASVAPAPSNATANCFVNRPTIDNNFSYDTRVDYNLSAKDQAFASFSNNNHTVFHTPPLGPILDGGGFYDTGPSNFSSENLAISETHIFSPTLINEFRIGVNHGHFTLQQPNGNTNVAKQLGLGGIPYMPTEGGLPYVSMQLFRGTGGAANTTTSNAPLDFGTAGWMYTTEHQQTVEGLDNVTKIAGNHTIKMGVEIEYIRFSTIQPQLFRGEYNMNGEATGGADGTDGSGIADFLLDQIDSTAMTAYGESDDLRWDNAAYIQDDWKMNSRLTLNLGLRWEDPTAFRDLKGRQANFEPTSPFGINTGTANYLIPTPPPHQANPDMGNFQNIVGNRITVVYDPNQYLASNDWTSFAPRLGLAYRLTNRAVIRGGYGVFFGGLSPIGYGPSPGADFPFLPTDSWQHPSCAGAGHCPTAVDNTGAPFTLENGFTNVMAAGLVPLASSVTVNGIATQTKAGYAENYNATGEYQFTNSTAFTLAYVGTQSHKMQSGQNLNTNYAIMKSGTNLNVVRPFPNLGNIGIQQYVGQSSYNSLQANLQQRAAHGLTYQANYTWSNQAGAGAPDAAGLRPAKSGIHASHLQRFTLNGNWQLPYAPSSHFLNEVAGGWASSLTFVAQTGDRLGIGASSSSLYHAASGGGGTPIEVSNPLVGGGTVPYNNPSSSCPATVHTRDHWYNPCAFTNPTVNGVPMDGRTIPAGVELTGAAALPWFGNFVGPAVYGPGYARFNLSLFKDFGVREGQKAEFRLDVFNLLNTPSLGNPSGGISGSAGRITAPRSFQTNTPDARFFQFSLKYIF
ncbi:MAG TPA: carboxypeptidase-like regulatory domain-containing protein [Terriglobales bacterium]